MKSMVAVLMTLLWVGLCGLAQAQDTPQAPIPFEGGTLTITETNEGDKVLAFDSKELARNYVAYLDKIVDVGDTKVALFAVGDGGNQCGTATVIVWKPADSDVKTATVGEECGAPPAAVAGYSIYFVPYLLPGASDTVLAWTLDAGLEVVGRITFMPQPGTGWNDLDPAKLYNIVDSLKNEAVYEAARKLLGDRLTDVITGLLTGGGTEQTASGFFYASGCVPHACGGSDGFMAIDLKGRKLYFAQQSEDTSKSTWPPIKDWPAELKEAKETAIGQ